MKTYFKIIFIPLLIISCTSNDNNNSINTNASQTYPSLDSTIKVTINNLSFDTMEPFVASNGNYLFFHNLNDGINTKRPYTTKVNDSTFNYTRELAGANQTTALHLHAIADRNTNGNFYWTSTRNYPKQRFYFQKLFQI